MTENQNSNESRTFLGMPVSWDRERMFWNVWNPQESRILLPKYFGIGWDINFHALLKKAKLIRK